MAHPGGDTLPSGRPYAHTLLSLSGRATPGRKCDPAARWVAAVVGGWPAARSARSGRLPDGRETMRRVRRIPAAFVAAAGLFLLLAPASRAAVSFDFVTDNGNSNYTVLPNGTATVDVFLRETL